METELKHLRIDRPHRISIEPRPRTTRLMASAGALCLLLGAALVAYRRMTRATEVELYRVKRAVSDPGRPGRNTILDATGYIIAAHKIEVASKVPGRVAWIGVDKGDRVRQGQMLVRLEENEFRAHVIEARGYLDNLKEKLAELEHGSRPQEIAKARAEFESAKAGLTNDQLILARTRTLVSAGIMARQAFDDAQARYQAQAGKVSSLEQVYELEKLGPREEQIRSMRAQVEQAAGSLRYMQTQLEATVIRAPVRGTILDRNVEKGEYVTTGFVGDRGPKGYVVSLADLNDLEVELDIDQNNFSKLKADQPAMVACDAFPDRRYLGRIGEISPEANRQKATVQIKIKIEQPDNYLRPDMNATVSFLEDESSAQQTSVPSAALIVPQSAVQNGSALMVENAHVIRRRLVLDGPGPGGLRVRSGLSEGDEVILNPRAKLKDGDKARMRKPR